MCLKNNNHSQEVASDDSLCSLDDWSVSSDLGVIPPDTLGRGEPSVLLLGYHGLQAGLVLDERGEDHEDIADVRNKVSEGAVEEHWRYLSCLNINMYS